MMMNFHLKFVGFVADNVLKEAYHCAPPLWSIIPFLWCVCVNGDSAVQLHSSLFPKDVYVHMCIHVALVTLLVYRVLISITKLAWCCVNPGYSCRMVTLQLKVTMQIMYKLNHFYCTHVSSCIIDMSY